MRRRIWTTSELAGLLMSLVPMAQSRDAKYIIWALANAIGIPTCEERPRVQVERVAR